VMAVRSRNVLARGGEAAERNPSVGRPHTPLRTAAACFVAGVILLIVLNGVLRFAFISSLTVTCIALSVVVLTGYVGQVSLAQMSLAGIGGFALGHISSGWGIGFPWSLVLAGLCAVPVGLIIGLPALRLRGLQGYAGQCAHVMGWAARRDASHKAMAPLMETRERFAGAGLPVEIVAGASTGTYDIDSELAGLTELQSGSYCVMDLDYRRVGGRAGAALTDFEMALTVVSTVVSVAADRAMVDAGLKAFSTDKPFPPEAVERPGVEYGFAGDEHGRLTIVDAARAPRLGERIEFFPPHCDPTFNLYDRVWVMRGTAVEAVWEIAARGRSD